MKRREFITLLGGVAAWPLAARAQQGERTRRIGVLMSAVEGDQRGLESITAFAQGLAELGWTVGRNVRIEYRLTGSGHRIEPATPDHSRSRRWARLRSSLSALAASSSSHACRNTQRTEACSDLGNRSMMLRAL
jgi:hypothetical protein